MKTEYYYMMLLLALCQPRQAYAQFEKGTGYWGGTISSEGNANSIRPEGDGGTTNKVGTHSISVKLQGGTFVRDNFMVGVGLAGSWRSAYGKTSGGNVAPSSTSAEWLTYEIVPYARWYRVLHKDFSAFLEASVGVGEERQIKPSYKTFVASMNIVPGVSYRLGRRFALEADINVLQLGLNYKQNKSARDVYFNTSWSSSLSSYFSLRGAFYLN